MNVIEQLRWRYATKKFDNTLKLSESQLETLIEAVNLAPSSYGLQPFQILVIESSDLREQLLEFSRGQRQVTDASHLLLFAVKQNLTDTDIENYLQRISAVRNISVENLREYGKKIARSIASRSPEARFQWASRQAYIALGVLMAVCAQEGIDACPIEGFESAAYDEVLGLTTSGYTSTVLAAVGFRAQDDEYQHKRKVRKELKTFVTYYR
jgi:nitroreductase / dihydropteridine reductase